MNESLAHLIELRQRLLRYVLVLGVVFAVFAFFANDIYHILALPLLAHVTHSQGLIATSVPAPFFSATKKCVGDEFFL